MLFDLNSDNMVSVLPPGLVTCSGIHLLSIVALRQQRLFIMLQAKCWPCLVVKTASHVDDYFELYETTASMLGLQQAKESFLGFEFFQDHVVFLACIHSVCGYV